jgi:hypothetical protein
MESKTLMVRSVGELLVLALVAAGLAVAALTLLDHALG